MSHRYRGVPRMPDSRMPMAARTVARGHVSTADPHMVPAHWALGLDLGAAQQATMRSVSLLSGPTWEEQRSLPDDSRPRGWRTRWGVAKRVRRMPAMSASHPKASQSGAWPTAQTLQARSGAHLSVGGSQTGTGPGPLDRAPPPDSCSSAAHHLYRPPHPLTRTT